MSQAMSILGLGNCQSEVEIRPVRELLLGQDNSYAHYRLVITDVTMSGTETTTIHGAGRDFLALAAAIIEHFDRQTGGNRHGRWNADPTTDDGDDADAADDGPRAAVA